MTIITQTDVRDLAIQEAERSRKNIRFKRVGTDTVSLRIRLQFDSSGRPRRGFVNSKGSNAVSRLSIHPKKYVNYNLAEVLSFTLPYGDEELAWFDSMGVFLVECDLTHDSGDIMASITSQKKRVWQ